MPRSHGLAAALADPAGVRAVSDTGVPWPRIPPEVGALRDLERLTLNRTGLCELPPELWMLPRLRTLNLWQNEVAELPADVARLPALETVVLGVNPLRTLPAELAGVRTLRTLNLANCAAMDWSQAFPVICALEGLEHLALYQNAIAHLPPEISRLGRLRTLHLYGCALEEVPETLVQLRELRDLDLRANRLRRPPPPLPWLERLDVSYNPIDVDTN